MITDLFTAWRVTALICLVAAVSLPLAARGAAGPPGALVHVRWHAAVDEAARHTLEVRFRLIDGERLDGTTWRYDIVDPSAQNIRALVRDAAVADTHHLDRSSFALDGAARTARRGRFAFGDAIVAVADALATALALLATLVTVVALSHRVAVLGAARRSLTRIARHTAASVRRLASLGRWIGSALSGVAAALVRFLERGVPEVHAETAGLFRTAFGTAVVIYFAFHHVDASWLAQTFDPEVEGLVHTRVLEWFGERPFIVNLITPWLLTFGVAFVVGLFTWVTYPLFVAGVLLWAWVAMSVESTHPHAALVLTIVALLPSRWSDAWSADAWLRRTRRAPLRAATKRYGYTVWVPILTFGVGFAAAAWAKLTVPPSWTSWVLNGTIKYHLITDSADAPLQWGVQLVRFPTLAILLSFGAIATEALVITAAFSRNELWRLAMGAAAAALLAGIGLFMGIAWSGWWIPLIAFLPWRRWSQRLVPGAVGLAAAGRRAGHHALSAAQLVVVVAVIMQQVVVSTLKLERAPIFSWYDMYAPSYTSQANYNARVPPVYHIIVAGEAGRVELRCGPHQEFVREFEAAVKGVPEARTRVWRALRGCGADPARTHDVRLVGRARTFDWDRLTFRLTHELSLGPLAGEADKAAP